MKFKDFLGESLLSIGKQTDRIQNQMNSLRQKKKTEKDPDRRRAILGQIKKLDDQYYKLRDQQRKTTIK